MSSKREEERNEKIISGLMKLPPNRRCINCSSLGPQYVCTNFWTFVCMTCSGIHREFTHRVKSISMAKFTSQEVDALQKGGNQRAREIYLKAWDPNKQRLPDNSNANKVREFIRNVYVEKKYADEKSSDKPPRATEETRRASSYHSHSRSPPYDFQYEEWRYEKHIASLSIKSGSDHHLYKGRFSCCSSPGQLSVHARNERFENEGSFSRSFSIGGNPFRPGILSPSPQRDVGSPFSETLSCSSRGSTPWHHAIQSNEGMAMHEQGTASPGSSGSFDSMSFKSVNPTGLLEVISEPEQSLKMSHCEAPTVSSLPQPPVFTTFNGMVLFSGPIPPQRVTLPPKLPSAPYVDLFQECPISSVPTFCKEQPVAASFGQTSNAVIPNNRGWATFDRPQQAGPDENSTHVVVPSADGNNLVKYNPFSADQNSSSPDSSSLEFSESTYACWDDSMQKVEPATNNNMFWNAFEDSSGQQPVQQMLKSSHQDAELCSLDANKSLAFGVHEVVNNDGIVKTSQELLPPASGSSSHFHFATIPAMDVKDALATEHKPTNPFDLPYSADFECSSMVPYVVGSVWFPQNSIPAYVPSGITFGPECGSLGYMIRQVPTAKCQYIEHPCSRPCCICWRKSFCIDSISHLFLTRGRW